MTRGEPRRVTDSRVLAAMAHPLRRRLLDVLRVHGPATASTLAGRTGQTVANVSHHLRVLNASGLVEDAPELAPNRRERWWRPMNSGLRWSSGDFEGDPVASVVAEAAQSLNLDRHTSHVRAWFAASADERERWEDSAFVTDKWLHLTPPELTALCDEVDAVLHRWATRETENDGTDGDEERSPVLFFAYGLPGQP